MANRMKYRYRIKKHPNNALVFYRSWTLNKTLQSCDWQRTGSRSVDSFSYAKYLQRKYIYLEVEYIISLVLVLYMVW